MRILYTLLLYFVTPVIVLRLIWRGAKNPAYYYRIKERFAFYNRSFPINVVWFHAVSVGEAEALFPLALQIQKLCPDAKLLITSMTPTGSARIKAVMQDSAIHVYMPYDLPCVIHRFMQIFKPKLVVIMETEIWPNLFTYCGKNKIPLYIVNARLSDKSVVRYQKLPALFHPALAQVTFIATQSEVDRERFVAIGAPEEKVKNLGNIKFDVEVSKEIIEQGRKLKRDLFCNRFVWLIASTHKDEEIIFLQLYSRLKEKIPELLLILVPRHPERFNEVKKICEQQQFSLVMHTTPKKVEPATDIYIVDTVGELKMFYSVADVTFVAGSLVPVGGHNILEPAAVGVPILFGPNMNNFREIAKYALKNEAAIQCQTQEDIVNAVLALYEQVAYREALIARAKAFVSDNQGAIGRVCEMLEPVIN